MTDQNIQAEVLATIRDEIAAERKAADAEHGPAARHRRLEGAAIRAEVAEEEAAAIAEEIAENKERVWTLRVPESLSRVLEQRATAEHVSVPELVRRLLTEAVRDQSAASSTVEQMEQIARRVAREEMGRS